MLCPVCGGDLEALPPPPRRPVPQPDPQEPTAPQPDLSAESPPPAAGTPAAGAPEAGPALDCPACGQPGEPGGQACRYCGEPFAGAEPVGVSGAAVALMLDNGRRFPLHGSHLLLGRDPMSPVCADLSQFTNVSRAHAQLTSTTGRWFVTDLGSTNGTRLNDVPLTAHRPAPVRPGDELQLGAHCVIRILAAAPSTGASQTGGTR